MCAVTNIQTGDVESVITFFQGFPHCCIVNLP